MYFGSKLSSEIILTCIDKFILKLSTDLRNRMQKTTESQTGFGYRFRQIECTPNSDSDLALMTENCSHYKNGGN